MKRKLLLVCSAAAASLTGAQAIEMTLAGSTAGSFNGAPFSSPATLGALTYTGASAFSETTIGNYAALVLGNFSVGPMMYDYAGDTFRLQFTFTAPTGITPGGPATFSANMVGSVNANGDGGVGIDFLVNSQSFTFATPNGPGSFVLNINDVNVQPGIASVDLTGSVIGGSTATAVPDSGSSVAMLGLGLLGLAAAGKKRHRTA